MSGSSTTPNPNAPLQWNLLRFGMTPEQVISILGEPSSSKALATGGEGSRKAVEWRYVNGRGSVIFDAVPHEKPISYTLRVKGWSWDG